jgi:class 3 adenylate cyclase/tetratricopeptide (TPR) repeat protein
MAGRDVRRERKVVSVLFCDLVGFTSRAESLDPEDVEAILRPYHARVRAELERHGGTVEKFIGDAVVAFFGAPVAHEDDPERAVRAALAIRDFALEEDLELRIGITTGEAVVSLDDSPAEGKGMASGDVVNTASRLQNAAPVNGILIDETTRRATRHAVELEEAQAVEAKGKSQPIPVWRALGARARFGVDVAHEARAELVGRERELTILREAFDRARHERTPQLVTLVGVPGIGKSRLVHELSLIADADPELITWRQGRCLAYGDGVTLWGLGEIVKAQAGIVEQDTPDEVEAKVGRAVEDALPDSSDGDWIASHLLALLGLAGEAQLGGDRRNEAFAAWRRFLEALAEQRPLVVVFEDLHWADESLLDFVDELVDWLTDVPLLVVGTARPELLVRRPGWGGGKLNSTTLALPPLTDEQTSLLLAQLLDRPVIAAESQQVLLERAGGNPLYAEQFAELYLERGSAEDLPLPETLQGLIAARLDGLPANEKELLRDGAVVGKVFWTSALRSARDDAASTLHSLERKGFVRRQRRSSVEGETEFAFAHALVRDVAYGQIARADRADKHRHTAEWIEELGRPDDHAEMLAHHWQAALELARASGRPEGDLEERTRFALRDAGDRAFALNAYPAAERYYADALALWPEADPERPDLLFRRARSLHFAADERREEALEEARDALLEAGAVERAAEAESFLAHGAWYRGQRDAADAHLERARALVGDRDASPAKARVLSLAARFQMLAADNEGAIEIAQEALALAEALSLDELRAHALATIGASKNRLDVSEGRRELEEALAIAIAASSPTAGAIMNNLAVLASGRGELRRANELHFDAQEVSARFGDADGLLFTRGNSVFTTWVLGDWDKAAEMADAVIAACEVSPNYAEGQARGIRALIRVMRGDADGALEDSNRALELARTIKDPQRLIPSILGSARVRGLLGREAEARALAQEALDLTRERVHLAAMLSQIGIVAGRLGIRDELRKVVELAPESQWKEAALAFAEGDFGRAAELFVNWEATTFEAEARLFAGEQLIADGHRREGEAEVERALEFFRSVGATFYVERGEALLAKSA